MKYSNIIVKHISLVAVLLVILGCTSLPAGPTNPNFDLYRFEQYGFSIEVPKGWELKDPAATKAAMEKGTARLTNKKEEDVKEALKGTDTVLTALEAPYNGPKKERPGVTCMVSNMGFLPANFVLDQMRQTYLKYERGAKMTDVTYVKISGRIGYHFQITFDPQRHKRLKGQENVGVKHRDALILCNGAYTQANEAAVKHAMQSIRLF